MYSVDFDKKAEKEVEYENQVRNGWSERVHGVDCRLQMSRGVKVLLTDHEVTNRMMIRLREQLVPSGNQPAKCAVLSKSVSPNILLQFDCCLLYKGKESS